MNLVDETIEVSTSSMQVGKASIWHIREASSTMRSAGGRGRHLSAARAGTSIAPAPHLRGTHTGSQHTSRTHSAAPLPPFLLGLPQFGFRFFAPLCPAFLFFYRVFAPFYIPSFSLWSISFPFLRYPCVRFLFDNLDLSFCL